MLAACIPRLQPQQGMHAASMMLLKKEKPLFAIDEEHNADRR
jgi:hypothetical protein